MDTKPFKFNMITGKVMVRLELKLDKTALKRQCNLVVKTTIAATVI